MIKKSDQIDLISRKRLAREFRQALALMKTVAPEKCFYVDRDQTGVPFCFTHGQYEPCIYGQIQEFTRRFEETK